MKILILNGSPRPKGSVTKILSEVTSNLKNKFKVENVNVYNLNIKPCVGCRGCRRNEGTCVLKEDDAHEIGHKINEADAVIIGSPTHFNNMSSPLKALLDRNGATLFAETSMLPKSLHKGKPAMIVTACMSPKFLDVLLGMSRGTIKNIKLYLKYGGFKIVGNIVKTGTEKSTDLDLRLIKKIDSQCKKLERKLSAA